MMLAELSAPVTTVAVVLAQQPGGGDHGGQGEDFGKSSPIGLLVLLLFLIAVVLLVRSMTKHLKRVPASFDNDEPASGAQPDAVDADDPGQADTGTAGAAGSERGAGSS